MRRSRWIQVRHTGHNGEARTATAEGANAVLWQHEIDHLDGVLFVDRLVGPLMPMDEVRRRTREMEQRSRRPGSPDRLVSRGPEGETLAL